MNLEQKWQAYDDISLHIVENCVLSDEALQSCSEEYREQYQKNRKEWYSEGEYSDPQGKYV